MPDLSHIWGMDLEVAPNGDLQLTDGDGLTKQRVLRRLLTNTGDYIWDLPYGAGLPQAVGRPISAPGIAALVRSHMRHEITVATSPAPVIELSGNSPNSRDKIVVNVRYVNSLSGSPDMAQLFPGN